MPDWGYEVEPWSMDCPECGKEHSWHAGKIDCSGCGKELNP